MLTGNKIFLLPLKIFETERHPKQLCLCPPEVMFKTQLTDQTKGKNSNNSQQKLINLIFELKRILVNVNLTLIVKTSHTVGYGFDLEMGMVSNLWQNHN